MNPELSLCEHLRSLELSVLPVDPTDILEWNDGPVVAVVRCRLCEGAGLIEMVDWSASRSVRVFGLAAFDLDVFAVFLRNTQRGSCDASRLERERHALLSSTGPVERLVVLDLGTNGVRAVAPYSDEGAEQVRRLTAS